MTYGVNDFLALIEIIVGIVIDKCQIFKNTTDGF